MRNSRSSSAHKVNYILAWATRGSMEREREEMKVNGGGKDREELGHIKNMLCTLRKLPRRYRIKKIFLTLIN